jgi:CDGSH-type Zn-finger protein/uncharacterized Fe-S cluster protein YjdI
MPDKKVFKFHGEKMEVSWDGRLCIHVGECTRAPGELFMSGRDPWAQPDRGQPDDVARVVQRCPTGALTYTRSDGGPEDTPSSSNVVTIANNGPLYFEGDLTITGLSENMPGVRFRAALCRCGDSRNKPFCDNTHEKNEFRDRGALGDSGQAALESTGGPLEVKPAPDGPLLVTGNFTIRTGAGREGWKGTKAALCRCGASKNKPFCDGAHKDAGFKAG